VPVVDVLGIAEYFQQWDGMPSFFILQLQRIEGALSDIFNEQKTQTTILKDAIDANTAALKHVEVDSYVNVRVVDDLGVIPIPATALTGLLVSAFAGGTVPVNIQGVVTTHPQLKSAQTGTWEDQVGMHVDRVGVTTDAGFHYLDPGSGVVPIGLTSGMRAAAPPPVDNLYYIHACQTGVVAAEHSDIPLYVT
jgi:hypothetical protein